MSKNRAYVPLTALLDSMNAQNKEKAYAIMPDIAGLFCFAFPYFAGKSEGNISLYARGRDYHTVIKRRLEDICRSLEAEYPQHKFLPFADISPFPEAEAAARAGLGKLGKNGLLITPRYGSFVFVGVIATNLLLKGKTELKRCRGCNACVRECPGSALSGHGFDRSRCLSEITQKRGELSESETALLRKNAMLWGCDRCQLVCPENKDIAKSDISEFCDNLICALDESCMNGSNRAVEKKYADRAFIWRGASVLKRNAKILKKE